MVFNATDRERRVFKRELATALRDGECVTERANVHKDGIEVMVHDTVTPLLDSDKVLIGFAKVTRVKDADRAGEEPAAALELAKALATIQVEVTHRRRLEAQLLTAVEEERERLGRDLHDDLSQRLAGIAMMTRTLAKAAPGRSAADREKITEVGHLLSDAIGVARNLSRGLYPVTLSTQGLPAALAELAGRVPKQVEFNSPTGDRLNIEASVALHVYRVAEEAIGNAIKHSGADRITIELKPTSARRAVLTVHDNGKGFSQRDGQGMGLDNMRYRAGIIGGKLTISTEKGHGTCIGCTLPLTTAVLDNGKRR
jgi:signal transduction histidine kinase